MIMSSGIMFDRQSLAMYVPPDEALKEQGEVNMTYQADSSVHTSESSPDESRRSSERQSQASTVPPDSAAYPPHLASVNPIYQR